MSIRILVYGKVQGVFFRQNILEKALFLNLTGYVRNLDNGTVEIEADGPHEKLQQLFFYAKIGPPSAIVEKIFHEYKDKKFKKFVIL